MAAAAAALLALSTLLPSAARAGEGADAYPFGGPLRVTNVHPLYVAAGSPAVVGARPRSSASVTLTYGSTYLAGSSPRFSVGLDTETLVVELALRKAVTDRFELGLAVPVVSQNDGFMDGALEAYHSAFGFPDYGRSERPHNAFLYNLDRDGRLVLSGEGGGAGVGDVTASLKGVVFKREKTVVSLYGYVELPTGSARRGYGTGSPGAGAAILADARVAERLMVYLNGGYAVTGDLEATEVIPLSPYPFGAVALEWAWREGFALIGQYSVQGSPFETGIDALDGTSMLLSFGGRLALAGGSVELAFTEDPNTTGAPDFSLTVGYSRTF